MRSHPGNGIARTPAVAVICRDELRYTRLCVESILDAKAPLFRLIIVDNGSRYPTKRYLDRISSREQRGGCAHVTVIHNRGNRGVAAAFNQAIEHSLDAPFVCLLNNDVIVTDGWLARLLSCAGAHPRAGIIGANTPLNRSGLTGGGLPRDAFPGPIAFKRLAGAAALRWAGQTIETSMVHGFCMFIRREVIDRVGLFDERFTPFFGEDLDYSLRARRAGWRLLIARDALLYHFFGKTVSRKGQPWGKAETVKRRMRDVFVRKWGAEGIDFLDECGVRV